jgi:uncharacterized protein YraI
VSASSNPTVPVVSASDPVGPAASFTCPSVSVAAPTDPTVWAVPLSDASIPDPLPLDLHVKATASSDPVVQTNPGPDQAIYATCITSVLNVREGPGTSFPMVAGLQYGQRMKVINRQNGWAQFEKPSGWSSEAYLTFDQENSPAPIASSQPLSNPESYGICNTSGLNVRGGPGVTYPVVGGLTYGQRIKILGHKNGWAQIESPSGWCNETYLSFA